MLTKDERAYLLWQADQIKEAVTLAVIPKHRQNEFIIEWINKHSANLRRRFYGE